MNNEMVTEKLNVSLSKEQKKKLTNLADMENRKYSQQIVHMMEFYLKYKDKVK
jgi:hypothetical protein